MEDGGAEEEGKQSQSFAGKVEESRIHNWIPLLQSFEGFRDSRGSFSEKAYGGGRNRWLVK